jgi:Fe-S oxidoreductase
VRLVADLLAEGKIRVQSGMFDTPLTYHDPCNIGRNAGMFEEPRRMLATVAMDFRELAPNRELNWCFGGGGLIATTEMMDAHASWVAQGGADRAHGRDVGDNHL